MCNKTILEILGNNIIHRFEELYGKRNCILERKYKRVGANINCIMCGKIFPPYAKDREIFLHKDYVSFLWGFIYGSWVQYEEWIVKEELNQLGENHHQNPLVIKHAQKVLELTLENKKYLYTNELPYPNIRSKIEIENDYMAKVNAIFLDALCLILFHEVYHIKSKHYEHWKEYSNAKKILCEKDCDMYALKTVFKNFVPLNECQFNTTMMSTLHAFAAMLFLLDDPLQIIQEDHPDLDVRLSNIIESLDLQNKYKKYYIYKYADTLLRHFCRCHHEIYDFMNIKFENKTVETAHDLFDRDIACNIEKMKFPALNLLSFVDASKQKIFRPQKIHGYLSNKDVSDCDKPNLVLVTIDKMEISNAERLKESYVYIRSELYEVVRNDTFYYREKDRDEKKYYYYMVRKITSEQVIKEVEEFIVSANSDQLIDRFAFSTNVYSENLLNKTSICAVFSCPGRLEEKAKQPCSGVTGKALKYILDNIQFNGDRLNRSLIGINNAWDKVEYLAKTKRSEANDDEILTPSNIDRLKHELRYTSVVIAFGNKAACAIKEIKEKYRRNLIVIETYHLSSRCINSKINKDIDEKPLIKGKKGNMKKRWGVVAKEIVKKSNGIFEEIKSCQ